jgi:UDP-glucose 4-epimerase
VAKTLTSLEASKILVTGGAGFIGSHLVDRLMKLGCQVTVLDDLSQGNLKNLEQWLENPRFCFIEADLKDRQVAVSGVEGVDVVFHFAANPEVRMGETDPTVHFRENLMVTFNVLEAMRKSRSAKTLVFASTSTVYGEAMVLPTPEDYGPMVPISTYGASKLGCEALAYSYAYTFGVRALILRVANVVGSRSNHGVIRKLEAYPERLEILGDGTQRKSYLHVRDFVGAALHLTGRFLSSESKVDMFNVGSADQVGVRKIAEIVTEQMGLDKVTFVFTGGIEGRGWFGDVKVMHLSVSKLLKTAWKPKYNSAEAVKLAAKELLKERIH